jgi:hypothetical protein
MPLVVVGVEKASTPNMKPVFQTIFDSDGGNCLTACIASILELPIDEVPNFAQEHGDNCQNAVEKWLASKGLRFIEIGFSEYQTFCDTFFNCTGEYCILSGPSTYVGRSHAVVGRVSEEGSKNRARPNEKREWASGGI